MAKARGQSAWVVLRQPVFRAVWLADFVANLGFFAQSVGAGWLMTSLTQDAHIVALVQTASSLPLFLVAIPSGVLADLVDRRRLIRSMNVVMVLLAALLAAITALHFITPAILLVATFALGLAAAVQEPAWGALIPEIVSESELPSAIALNGLDFNLSRVISPPLAGLTVAAFGPAAAFAINAASFLPTVAVMRPQETGGRATIAAMREGFERTLRLVSTSAPIRDVLLRNAAFAICASVIFALLPLYVRSTLHASSAEFGLLFGALGVGSVAVAQFIGVLRGTLGVPNSILFGTILLGGCIVALGLTHSLLVAYATLFLAGFGWLTVLSTLNTAIQFAVPPEHRAAGFALYLVTAQGISAFGSAGWGAFAASFGTNAAFVCAGILFVMLGVATWRVPLPWKADS